MSSYSRARMVLALVFVLGSTSAFAQGEGAIHGVVTARADGSTIAEAVVELKGAPSTAARATTAGNDDASP